ncbi:hypothetical protein ABZ622_13895 [Streptomyces sp. NPDC007164]|uniref:hypothetical protein n=1 Tax=Streptomyces sp. NPDC007164 TaxID=3156918 RepID=UPI0034044BA4
MDFHMSVSSQYRAAHLRVEDEYGKANVNTCAWCGGFADHWAYDWTDRDQHEADGRTWSDDPERYMPLCIRDHAEFDKAYRRVGLSGLEAEIAPLRAEAGKRYDEEQRRFIERVCTQQAILSERVRAAEAMQRIAELRDERARLQAANEVRQRRANGFAFKDSDTLAGFFPGLFELGSSSDVFLGADLYDVYREWCERFCNRLGIRVTVPLGRTSFYRALEERGAARKKTDKGIAIYGIKFA